MAYTKLIFEIHYKFNLITYLTINNFKRLKPKFRLWHIFIEFFMFKVHKLYLFSQCNLIILCSYILVDFDAHPKKIDDASCFSSFQIQHQFFLLPPKIVNACHSLTVSFNVFYIYFYGNIVFMLSCILLLHFTGYKISEKFCKKFSCKACIN